MHIVNNNNTELNMRPPQEVMRLARIGSFHQSRLSFMRVLLRRLKRDQWSFDRPIFDIQENGMGLATYRARGPKRTYTLVAFSHNLPPEKRSDRVIAEAWDATFTLFDGEPTEEDIERLSKNVPLQEAGRISENELSLSRANKSVRLFSYVMDCLSRGEQPAQEEIEKVGYLMRTTAVYGSGKFGAADRSKWADREEFLGSFQPELLSVWLTRAFTLDLVEHLAKLKSPDTAVAIEPNLRRRFGVGNSTGLGMAPFLMNHPTLIHTWINARESALAKVRSLASATPEEIEQFKSLAQRALINAQHWHSEHPLQIKKTAVLLEDLEKLNHALGDNLITQDQPWENLFNWCQEHLGIDAQEQVVSLMLEPYGDLVDDLCEDMCCDETGIYCIDGRMSIGEIKSLIKKDYPWIFETDFTQENEIARVWYVSEEKLEPRLGERFEEELDDYEQPLCPGRDAKLAFDALEGFSDEITLAEFLIAYPEHRQVIRRIQQLTDKPYGEIYDNTIAADMLPIDLLRCKLSFFGATHFDPRSDRWVRITMYQGAPFPHELSELDPDDMAYPQEAGI